MSSFDLYEDGFPHGTKEGYDRGCRGAACPAALEGGQTCATAKSRYNGDYHYRRRVDAGLTPAQIAEAEAVDATPPPVHRLPLPEPKPVARPKLPDSEPVTAEWPEEDEPADHAEPDLRNATADVTVDPTTGKTIPRELHGTHKGYWKGCRDIACPGVAAVGKSCRAALNEYTRNKRREKLEQARAAEEAAPATVDDTPEHAVEEAAPEVATDEPAIAAPELTAEQLVKVEAFGLHEPEHDEPEPLAEWEHELLRLVNDEFVHTTDELDALAAGPRQPTDYADDILERDAKIAELERKLRRYEGRSGSVAPAETQRVVGAPGQTIKITVVGDACEITIGAAS